MPRSFARLACLGLAAAALVAGPLAAQEAAPVPAPAPPEPWADVDRLCTTAVESGGLPGLSIAVVRDQEVLLARAYGLADKATQRAATPDTIYRIGSVSKVLTTALLVEMRDAGEVQLDDPVAKYLPPGTVLPTEPAGAPQITLRHLATHTSGLPRLPPNMTAKDGDPYGGYPAEALLAGLPQTSLEGPIGARYGYSNLGSGLLGHVLAQAGGKPYDELLRERVLAPLGMASTYVTLPPELVPRYATGYLEQDPSAKAPEWDLGSIAGAGGHASTVLDLARFTMIQFKAGQAGVTPISGASLWEMQQPQRLAGSWRLAVGLGWHVFPMKDVGDVVWHDGGTAGFHSYMAFAPDRRVGIVALTNSGKDIADLGRALLLGAVKVAAPPPPPAAVPEKVKAVAEALGKYFVPQPQDTFTSMFHPDFFKSVPAEKIKELFQQVAAAGTLESVTVAADTAKDRWRAAYRFAGGDEIRCVYQVDGATPPQIVYLFFPPVGG